MTQQMRPFPGLPNSFMSAFTFGEPALPGKRGIYLGTTFSGDRFSVHPWALQNEGGTFATTWFITGQIGYRKSALKKLLALRGARLIAGYDPVTGERIRMRIRMHGRKHLQDTGKCENDPVMQRLGGRTVPLRWLQLNPFGVLPDRDGTDALDELDRLEIAVMFAEHAAERHISAVESLMLQVGMWRMLQMDPQLYSLAMFQHLVATLEERDVKEYFANNREYRLQQYYEKFKDVPHIIRQAEEVFERNTNITFEEFRAERLEMSSRLNRILRNDYGTTFSGDESLMQLLTDAIINWDWLGMPPRATQLMELLQQKLLMVAHERGRDDLVPHMNLSDEGQLAMQSPEYAAMRARQLAVTRRFSTFDVEVAQYVRQIAYIGDAGSQLRYYGQTIMQTWAARIIGHVESTDKEGLEELHEMNMSEANIARVHNFGPGQFFFKVPTSPDPIPFTLMATPSELPLLRTSAAVESMIATGRNEHLDLSSLAR